MSELLGGYDTIDGDTYLKKRDDAGRTYYVREGDGRISESAFRGGQSRFQTAITSDDGNLLPNLGDAMSLGELRDKTGIPFDREGMILEMPEGLSETQENRLQELDRFRGFYERKIRAGDYERGEDDVAAAKEYLEFRAKIADADSEAVRQQIREQYMGAGY